MESGNLMTTLSQVINKLKKKGFDEDFEITDDGLVAHKSGKKYFPENLIIKKTYRFEGFSNPDDMSVLYAMRTDDGVKGIFVDAYGTYANNESVSISEFLKKVKIEQEV